MAFPIFSLKQAQAIMDTLTEACGGEIRFKMKYVPGLGYVAEDRPQRAKRKHSRNATAKAKDA